MAWLGDQECILENSSAVDMTSNPTYGDISKSDTSLANDPPRSTYLEHSQER